jgi:hypothetical protein
VYFDDCVTLTTLVVVNCHRIEVTYWTTGSVGYIYSRVLQSLVCIYIKILVYYTEVLSTGIEVYANGSSALQDLDNFQNVAQSKLHISGTRTIRLLEGHDFQKCNQSNIILTVI